MAKPLKQKKDKVPKITEEEYTAYLTSLKARDNPELGEEEDRERGLEEV